MHIQFKKIKKHPLAFFLAFLVVVFIVSFFLFNIFLKDWKFIKSDGTGYHAYLPALFIYQEIDMSSVVFDQKIPEEEVVDFWRGFYKTENSSNFINKYPIGVAVLSSPFFLIADFFTNLFNLERNGFSFFYQLFNLISACVFSLIGNFYLYKILLKRFSLKITFLVLITINFGTNLLSYTVYDSSFSHVYSFALFAYFFYLIEKLLNKFNFKTVFISALIFGLIVCVRNTNLIVGILYLLPFFKLLKDKSFNKIFLSLGVIAVGSFISFLPQILYWKLSTGSFLIFGYPGEFFNFLKPEFLNVLFSVRKGLFFWTPLLIFSVAGFFLMFRKKEKFAWALILILLIQLYIVSSWWAWSYGFAFGHRAFVEFLVFFSIPFGYFFVYILKKRVIKKLFLIVFGFLLFLNMYQTIQFWRGIIYPDSMSIERYTKIFLRPCLDVPIKEFRCD